MKEKVWFCVRIRDEQQTSDLCLNVWMSNDKLTQTWCEKKKGFSKQANLSLWVLSHKTKRMSGMRREKEILFALFPEYLSTSSGFFSIYFKVNHKENVEQRDTDLKEELQMESDDSETKQWHTLFLKRKSSSFFLRLSSSFLFFARERYGCFGFFCFVFLRTLFRFFSNREEFGWLTAGCRICAHAIILFFSSPTHTISDLFTHFTGKERRFASSLVQIFTWRGTSATEAGATEASGIMFRSSLVTSQIR